ncbi:hypothetical protein ACQ4PT_060363 [Festuca glaucescens]
MAAVSTKSVALLAVVLLVLVASAVATARTVEREEVFSLGSLAPSLAPAPSAVSAAGALVPCAWAVAALVSLLAFLAH